MNTLVVNFMGGPGAGKSTMAASVFSELKWRGIEVELVTEYAKDKVWEEATKILDNQLYVFAKQEQRVNRLSGKVKVILTDSSVLLTIAYAKSDIHKSSDFKKLVLAEFNKYDNKNYFIIRNDLFVENGRKHSLQESIIKDKEIEKILIDNNIYYENIDFIKENVNKIVNDIIDYIS